MERLLTISNAQVIERDGHLYLGTDNTEVTWDSNSKSLKPVVRTQEIIPDYVPREGGMLVGGHETTTRVAIHHGVTKLYTHVEYWHTGPTGTKEVKVQNVPENELLRYGTKREAHGRKNRMKKWATVAIQAHPEETVSYSTRAPKVWEGETGSQLVIQGENVAPQIDPKLLEVMDWLRAQAQGR